MLKVRILSFISISLSQLEKSKERIEEESEKKSDALKALSKASAEIQLWRSKFETEGLGRVEELEASKAKISARLIEAEETVDTLGQKISSTEKTKHRLVTELEDLQLEYERVHAAAVITEKRGRNFDKVFEKPELVLYVLLCFHMPLHVFFCLYIEHLL